MSTEQLSIKKKKDDLVRVQKMIVDAMEFESHWS